MDESLTYLLPLQGHPRNWDHPDGPGLRPPSLHLERYTGHYTQLCEDQDPGCPGFLTSQRCLASGFPRKQRISSEAHTLEPSAERDEHHHLLKDLPGRLVDSKALKSLPTPGATAALSAEHSLACH